jgi:hypothetical protein
MIPLRLTLAAFSFAASLSAQPPATLGSVFLDVNGDGRRDGSEPGLPNVVVSNQDAVATTDANGAFTLPAGGTGVVFVSVPDGYRAVGRFWHAAGDTTGFALAPRPRLGTFTFVHASDTHVSPASLPRLQRLRALVDSLRPAFALVTGDLVRDALRVSEAEATGYYELFAAERARFATPVHVVPGNHENFGIERQLSHVDPSHPLFGRGMYRHYFGPDYYSFTYGGVHFVGLNTVDIDDQWYYGHVDSLQLSWLERDLARIPATMPVVTFDHIPFFSAVEPMNGYSDAPPAPTLITVRGKTAFRHTVSNAADVLAVLRRRRHVLALGGHVHVAERLAYEIDGERTRFEQSAAIVGAPRTGGMTFRSGITVYTVRNAVVDAGRFVPLGMER